MKEPVLEFLTRRHSEKPSGRLPDYANLFKILSTVAFFVLVGIYIAVFGFPALQGESGRPGIGRSAPPQTDIWFGGVMLLVLITWAVDSYASKRMPTRDELARAISARKREMDADKVYHPPQRDGTLETAWTSDDVAEFVNRRRLAIPRDIILSFEQYRKIFHYLRQLELTSRDELPEAARDAVPESMLALVEKYDFQWAQGARSGIEILTLESFRMLQVNAGPFRSDIYRVGESTYISFFGLNDRPQPLQL
jgi:hypothetical protein